MRLRHALQNEGHNLDLDKRRVVKNMRQISARWLAKIPMHTYPQPKPQREKEYDSPQREKAAF